MEAVSRFWNRATGQPEVEPSIWDDGCFTLTKTQRLYGFGFCLALGTLCNFLAAMLLPTVALNPGKFATVYSLGNLISLFSTGFLVGPAKQVKNMFDPTRAMATSVYLVTLVMTLAAALYLHSGPLTLLMLIVQVCALAWYCLSYIPYGRTIVSSCCSSTIGV